MTKAEREAQFEHYYRTYSTRALADMLVSADAALERRRRGAPRPHAAKLLARAAAALDASPKHVRLAKEIREYLEAISEKFKVATASADARRKDLAETKPHLANVNELLEFSGQELDASNNEVQRLRNAIETAVVDLQGRDEPGVKFRLKEALAASPQPATEPQAPAAEAPARVTLLPAFLHPQQHWATWDIRFTMDDEPLPPAIHVDYVRADIADRAVAILRSVSHDDGQIAHDDLVTLRAFLNDYDAVAMLAKAKR